MVNWLAQIFSLNMLRLLLKIYYKRKPFFIFETIFLKFLFFPFAGNRMANHLVKCRATTAYPPPLVREAIPTPDQMLQGHFLENFLQQQQEEDDQDMGV